MCEVLTLHFLFLLTGGHTNIFTIAIHHGGSSFTPFGNRRYEGRKVDYVDWVNIDYFTRMELDGMALDLGHKLPVGFMYKPIGKVLNMGYMVVGDKEILRIVEDIERNRATKIDIYLVFPETIRPLE